MNLYIFVSFLSLFCYGYSEEISSDACEIHKTCGKCISYGLETCVWCSDESFKGRRCRRESTVSETWCQKEFRISPLPKINLTLQNDNFSPNVQFRPQKISIIARPGAKVDFKATYKPAEDFPVDVYFLMDYTLTMKKHKDALEQQALDIYTNLKKITSNVRLGVGSFIEKPALPYMDIEDGQLHYTYINHLSLTNDTSAFQNVVKHSNFGTNYDDAEAGLDALMQVMKCESEIGWRKQTRRIIVLATDNTYHSAGDGKMVGAIKPNDMQCHLQDNQYKSDFALKYDYPSVSQINKVAVDGKFLIIFAALPYVKNVYKHLSEQVIGSKYAELNAQESNILNIIKEAYEESVAKVKLDIIASKNFEIEIDQLCDGKETINCESTPKNPIVTIPITIRSKKCTDEIITIYPIGLEDKLNIDYRSDCKCDCEINIPIEKSHQCKSFGKVICGACQCDKGRGGDTCQYNCEDNEALKENCRFEKGKPICSSHGTCTCGHCSCEAGYTGDTCEYNQDSCGKARNGKICSGRGSCEYGKCRCLDRDYYGEHCDCPVERISSQQCTGPFSKKVCSGRGDCNCGMCSCHNVTSTEKYTGAFCEFCNDCASELCGKLEEYAKCNHNSPRNDCNKEFNITSELNIDVLVANKSKLRNLDEWKRGTQCRAGLANRKFLVFKYAVDPTATHTLLLRIQQELESEPEPDIVVPIASAILGILLIGILTVILWKVLVNMYDKREYAKFCDEAKRQGFDITQNPLYEPPTQNFINPGFNENMN